MITITLTDKELQRDLGELAGRIDNMAPVMKPIGSLIRASIRENFRAGGRPSGWRPSKRAGRQRGQTLRDTNRLYNSFTIDADRNRVVVGTNVEYAAAHNFGVNKNVSQRVRNHVRRISMAFGKPIATKEVRVKAHARQMHMNIPARPFMLLQPEDWTDIRELVSDHIMRGKR